MRLISDIAFMWMIRIATLASSALLGIITARALGPDGRGIFALPAIDASIAVTFCAGLSSAASYYLLNRKAGRHILHAMAFSFLIFVIAGFTTTVLTAVISHSVWAIGPALAYLCCYAGYSIVCGYYFGRNRARTAGFVNAMLSLASLVSVAASIWCFGRSPWVALGAWIAALALVATIGLCFVCADARNLEGQSVDVFAVIRFGAKTGLVNIANLLNYRVDIFIVAALLPVATLGMYTIAVTAAESALSLTLAVSQATLPRIGSLHRSEAGAFAARCLRNTLFLAGVLCGIGVLSAPFVVGLIFGKTYAPIVAPLRVLLVGIVAASTGSLISNYFVLNVGRTTEPLVVSALSSVLCGAASFALIPRVGIFGAALASTLAYIVSQAFALVLFCRESGAGVAETLFVDRRDFAVYKRLARRAARMSL